MIRNTYQNLRAQMALKGHSLQTLAQAVDIKYNTLCRKMRKLNDFTLSEMQHIRRALKYQGTLDSLFCDEEEQQ